MTNRNLDDPLRGYGLDPDGEDADRPSSGLRVLGGVAALAGIVLIILAVLAMTGMLGSGSGGDPSDASGGDGAGGTSASATDDSSSSASSSADATDDTPVDPDARAPLTVLNNTASQGLAAQAADTFASAGWEIANVDSIADNSVTETTVFYTDGSDEEEAAAKALQAAFPQITAVQPRPDSIPFTGVVVLLMSDV